MYIWEVENNARIIGGREEEEQKRFLDAHLRLVMRQLEGIWV